MRLDDVVMNALLSAVLDTDDPLEACESLKHALRERVLRSALVSEGWNLNATARRLRRSTSTVQYALENTYTTLNEERLDHARRVN